MTAWLLVLACLLVVPAPALAQASLFDQMQRDAQEQSRLWQWQQDERERTRQQQFRDFQQQWREERRWWQFRQDLEQEPADRQWLELIHRDRR